MAQDHRRYARTRVEVAVTAEAAGRQWHGKTLDLSPYGIKVAPLSKSVSVADSRVQLWLSLPDQEAPLALTANVERVDKDGIALSFVGLGEQESQRLEKFVNASSEREWEEALKDPGRGQRSEASVPDAQRTGMVPAGSDSERAAPSDSDAAEIERCYGLLRRLGLGNVQLPIGSGLSAPWRDFLKRVEAGYAGHKGRKTR